MSRFGITFNGKHSYNFGLTVASKVIGNPSKIKRKERVPFSNQMYDFSNIYGGQEYEERPLTYVFNLRNYDKVDLTLIKIDVLNWLMNTNGKVVLKDDYVPDYYFKAEVEDAPDFNELKYGGTLTVNFTAYPFKIAQFKEGHGLIDHLYIFDYILETSFDVIGSLDVKLYNPGATILYPKIICSSDMQIIKDGITYNVSAGNTTSYDFYLPLGESKLKLVGNGNIEFEMYKELI
ncbi:phage tail protein [Niallia circulans]|uniref:Phage tail protein n=1 Tax=Niallia circulans TaxID=1397 RepID=A0A941GGA1_NIACI|nr:phage tail protein [Niallia circulans]MCB5235514.1 phage tail protein [Niallia circulans]